MECRRARCWGWKGSMGLFPTPGRIIPSVNCTSFLRLLSGELYVFKAILISSECLNFFFFPDHFYHHNLQLKVFKNSSQNWLLNCL